MLSAILSILNVMGWLGVVLFTLVVVNTICGTIYNICTKQETFSWGKMLKGIAKAGLFYLSAALCGVAFTLLPFINEMIIAQFGVMLLSSELLNTLSSVGVLGLIASTIVVQGKKAVEGMIKLANVSADTEVITWEVKDPEEETEEA